MTRTRVHEAIATALAAVAGCVGPRGQWPGQVLADDAAPARDQAAPLTSLGMLALGAVPGADDLLARSRQHVELTVLPGGVWRYYAGIPWDTDDTAMCALALGADHELVEQSRMSLAATVMPDGRFPTWAEAGWSPVVDAVANAHVVALLGQVESTRQAIAWLLDVVSSAAEVTSSAYYVDPLDLHVALSRAHDRGVTSVEPALWTASERACRRLVDDRIGAAPLTDYRRAQAVLVAHAAVGDGPEVLQAQQRLMASQQGDGFWEADTLFVAGRTDAPGVLRYTSKAVTTALCAAALACTAAHWEDSHA